VESARLLSQTHCHNVIVLDVSGISPVTDFLVLGTGTSPIQMKSACDEVVEMGEPRGFHSLTRAGDSGTWTCIDLVDVVIHVFNHESRVYYDLDNLWGDARKIEWRG
jgi:ribosome-associated protein